MSTGYGGMSIPGVGALQSTTEREFIWGGSDSQIAKLYKNCIISGDIRDAGNTPTTVIRRGLLLGKITTSGKHVQWDSTATDGSQNIAAVLNVEIRAQDFDGNNIDRAFACILRAPMIAKMLLIKGSAFVGHADEYLARRQLWAAGIVLDDDPFGYLAGVNYRTLAKSADYTVVAADNGTYFTTRGASGAVNFTLPTIQKGLEYHFFNEADQNITLTAAAADTLVVFNDIAADSITASTSSEKAGIKYKVRANDNASKWLVEVNMGAEAQTQTVAT